MFSSLSVFSPRFGSFLGHALRTLAILTLTQVPVRGDADADFTAGLQFHGGDAMVSLDPSFSLAGQSFTVEAWVWLNDLTGDQSILAQSGPENLFHLLVRSGRLHLGFWNNDLTGNTNLPVNQWLHVAFTFDADSRRQRVYLNGVLDGERIASAQFAENHLPLQIGKYGTSDHFRGRILELRIWDSELTAENIADGRFSTPAADAEGLRALFTFEGIEGTDVPEAGGRLINNVLSGNVSVVSPVLAPARLDDLLLVPLPVGSLNPALTGYTLDPPPAVGFEDMNFDKLINGFGPLRVWGAPWFDFTEAHSTSLVRWDNASPSLTFTFAERVRIESITLHAAHSGGTDGVSLPASIGLQTPGGFSADFDIEPAGTVGTLTALHLDDLGLFTEEVTLTLQPSGASLALAEVGFDGAVLAQSAPLKGGYSLAAQRYFGLDPLADDLDDLQFFMTMNAAEARFEFPRAADHYGVRADVEWSPDLFTWLPIPHVASETPGRRRVQIAPPPETGRAFFRLAFSEAPPAVAAPLEIEENESNETFHFTLAGPSGPVITPHDPASLRIIAINDQDTLIGEAFTTPSGGILQIFADGTATYIHPPGMPGGLEVTETLTYTVADRLGGSVRNTLNLTFIGLNDPPVASNISASLTASTVPAGVTYRYFEGDFSDEAAFDTATPVSSGRMPTFSLDPATADTGYGLEMSGQLFVPAAGPYTFYLNGNNASVLDIGETRVVDYEPTEPVAERSGTITLEAGSHPIRLRYFDVVEAGQLLVEYTGPGLPRTLLDESAFVRLPDIPLDPLAVATDPDDGDILRVSHINGEAIDEANPVLLPSGATVLLTEAGSLIYQPASGRTILHGSTDVEDFTFTVSDQGGLTDTAIAQIQLARQNPAPVAGDIAATHTATAEPADVNYHYFEGTFESEAAFETAIPVSSGRMPTFSLDPAIAPTGYGLEMTAELFVPAPGPYTFILSGNNASVLDIGETRVVDHDPAAPAAERSGTIELTPGSHTIRVRYFDVAEADAQLSVEYVGPGFLREPIPAEALPRLESLELDPLASSSDSDVGDVLRVSHIDGQPLTSTPVRLASGAEVALNGNGTITYLPAPGRNLLHASTDVESFTFTVTDASGSAATATAQLQLARQNTAPVANPDFGPIERGIVQGDTVVALADLVADAEESSLRVTHVNGQPLLATETTLPSTARVSLNGDAELYYNPHGSFVITLDQPTAHDAFTVTVTDAAGATIEMPVSLSWTLFEFQLQYRDSRFDGNLWPRTAWVYSEFRFPVDTLVSITDRQTGIRYAQRSHTFGFQQTATFDFDLPPGIDLQGEHFFKRFALEIDRPDGVPIYYGSSSGNTVLERLYSSASRSYFRVISATSPHWPIILVYAPPGGSSGATEFFGGNEIIETVYDGVLQIFRLGLLARGASANKVDLEPTFAANIIIEGLCRTRDISRFSVENRNSENVPLTVGSEKKSVNVPAGSTVEFEVTYEPKVPIFVLEGDLGLFDSREVTCAQTFDFTVTSQCADSQSSFTQVINNDPSNAYTVRIESVQYPSIRSDPMMIGNQVEAFIEMNSQNQNLQGTEGRLIILLPDMEVIGAAFTFSTTSCN